MYLMYTFQTKYTTQRKVVRRPKVKVKREFYLNGKLVAWYEVDDFLFKAVFLETQDPVTGERIEAKFCMPHKWTKFGWELGDFAKAYRIDIDLVYAMLWHLDSDVYLAKKLKSRYE